MQYTKKTRIVDKFVDGFASTSRRFDLDDDTVSRVAALRLIDFDDTATTTLQKTCKKFRFVEIHRNRLNDLFNNIFFSAHRFHGLSRWRGTEQNFKVRKKTPYIGIVRTPL